MFFLKENQQSLYEDVAEYFQRIGFSHPTPDVMVESTLDVGHGRLELLSYVPSLDPGPELFAADVAPIVEL